MKWQQRQFGGDSGGGAVATVTPVVVTWLQRQRWGKGLTSWRTSRPKAEEEVAEGREQGTRARSGKTRDTGEGKRLEERGQRRGTRAGARGEVTAQGARNQWQGTRHAEKVRGRRRRARPWTWQGLREPEGEGQTTRGQKARDGGRKARGSGWQGIKGRGSWSLVDRCLG